MDKKVNGFFHNMTERGWAVLNEKGGIKTDCYNCNKYEACQTRKPEPCADYEMLKILKPEMN